MASLENSMNKNLGWKVLLITVTLLVFLFGVFGVPQTWSRHGLDPRRPAHTKARPQASIGDHDVPFY
jgi:hypothetical protein